MRRRRLLSTTCFLPMLLVLPACGGDEAEPHRVWFESPGEGEVVEGPDVLVRLGASGVRITPAAVQDEGTGHHHIFVDTDVTPMDEVIPAGAPGIHHLGDGQSEFLVEGLEPGEHRLIAVAADWRHVPLDPPAVDTVRFTVAQPEGESGS